MVQIKHFVLYEQNRLPYTIITNKKLRNFYITIDSKKGVVVKNPNYPLEKVHNIVEKKAQWIYEKVVSLEQRHCIATIYENEKKVLLFGIKEALHVKGNLAQFYKDKSQKFIPPLVEKWANIMHEKPTSIKFRKAKRKWGSCSMKNELSFNTSLVQLPLECIEYIIVHELSHIKHKHHKRDFWSHVQKFMSDFKGHERTLKSYSPEIIT